MGKKLWSCRAADSKGGKRERERETKGHTIQRRLSSGHNALAELVLHNDFTCVWVGEDESLVTVVFAIFCEKSRRGEFILLTEEIDVI